MGRLTCNGKLLDGVSVEDVIKKLSNFEDGIEKGVIVVNDVLKNFVGQLVYRVCSYIDSDGMVVWCIETVHDATVEWLKGELDKVGDTIFFKLEAAEARVYGLSGL